MGLAVEILGLVIFLGAHSFVTMRDRRAALIAKIGEWPYRGPIFGVDATSGKLLWTFFTVGGFVVACAFACIGLAMCFIGTNGALGFGRIAVVGMCQNNLNCVGSRARRRRVKKSGRW